MTSITIEPHKCPNPECPGGICRVINTKGKNPWYYVQCRMDIDKRPLTRGCGYCGPEAITAEEAVRLHNIISDALCCPEGWKLVPVEPTQEMIDWAFNNHAGAPVETWVIKPIWKEMLDHAPAISAPPETGAAIQNHAVCYVCGAPSFCAVNVLLGAAGGATLMRPVCDKHNPYSFVHPATDAEAAAAEIVARLQEAGHIPGEKANDWWIDIVVAIIKKHGAPAVGVAELEILMAKWQEELTVVDGWGSRGYTNAELLQRCSKELSAIIRGKK